ncbi:MAG: hypothetical protein KDA80_08190 [Planctomycetaceae bacterium]|nr:hypothetical protein [Planctomycetaceae bacterium]
MVRLPHRSEIVTALVVIALLWAYIWEVCRERRALAPPSGVDTLAQFAKSMPKPRHLALVENNGTTAFVWIGETSGPFDQPSGPSCYLFDTSGKLLAWQPDTGEGGPLDSWAIAGHSAKEMTLSEAIEENRE